MPIHLKPWSVHQPSVTRQLQCAKQCLRVYYHAEDMLVSSHVDEDGRYHIVALEGTDTVSNWFHNIMICRRKGVHVGFRKYATYFKKNHNLRSTMRALPPREPVYFTGHSLGASAGTLLAYDFSNDYRVGTVLFGSPKVGDASFNTMYRRKRIPTRSYRTKNDLVSRVPYDWLGYESLDHIVIDPDIPKHELLKNHSIHTYIQELTSLAYHDIKPSSK